MIYTSGDVLFLFLVIFFLFTLPVSLWYIWQQRTRWQFPSCLSHPGVTACVAHLQYEVIPELTLFYATPCLESAAKGDLFSDSRL